MSKEAFIRLVTSDQPEVPAYFAYDAMLNRRERPHAAPTCCSMCLMPLTLDDVVRQMNSGAQVVDVRDPEAFETALLVGQHQCRVAGQLCHLGRDRAGAGHADCPDRATLGKEAEAAMRLGRIGFDHDTGLPGRRSASLEPILDLVRRIERITATELATALAGAAVRPWSLDVPRPGRTGRQISRWESAHLPLNRLRAAALRPCPATGTVVLQCAGGYRSAIAASLLAKSRDGRRFADLVGGLAAWEAAGLDLVATTMP